MPVHRGQGDKWREKTVWYTGTTTTLRPGHLVCYDRNRGTATAADFARVEVEDPAAGNARWFAGVVMDIKGQTAVNSGSGTGAEIVICEPVGNPLVLIFTEENCTAGTTLLTLKPGSLVAGGRGEGAVIGIARQTVDRSTTNGMVLAELFTRVGDDPGQYAARSRTAVQLPTAAIWDNFPAPQLDVDFTGNTPWFNSFVDATYAASAGGKTPTEHIFPGPLAIGELCLFTTTDNQAAELQFPVPFTIPTILAPATKFAFEIRMKQSVLTTAKGGWFAGLLSPQKLVGNLIADAGTLVVSGALGFQGKEGALGTGAVDFIYNATGQTQNEYAAALATAVADTYFTVGMYYNGTTIQGYANGVAAGTAIPNANLDDADFPGAVIMVPTLAVKGAHADDYTVSVDWIRAAQLVS